MFFLNNCAKKIKLKKITKTGGKNKSFMLKKTTSKQLHM